MSTTTQPTALTAAREEVANWIAALKIKAVGGNLSTTQRQLVIYDLQLYQAALNGGATPEDTIARAMAYVAELRAVC